MCKYDWEGNNLKKIMEMENIKLAENTNIDLQPFKLKSYFVSLHIEASSGIH
jgi:hypothetical protein